MAAAATNEIEFVKGNPDGGSNGNVNVITSSPSDLGGPVATNAPTGIKGEKFQKVVMKPKTGGGSGQCKVYNSKLFTNERGDKIEEGAKIEDQVLTSAGIDSSGKYSSITVYYIFKGEGGGGRTTGTGKSMALLVEFVPVGTSCGKKRYIKRTGRGGNQWESKSGVGAGEDILTGTGSDSDMIRILLQQWEKLRPLIEFEKGYSGTGSGHVNITTSEPEEIRGQGDFSSQGYTFKKVTMTANIDGGHWKVYNGKLFTGYESSTRIDESLLDIAGITTGDSNKHRSITVYYAVKDNSKKALLVEFEKASTASGSSSDKIYIKRANQGGSTWAITTANDIGIRGTRGTGEVTAKELNKIRTNAGIGDTTVIQINTDKGQGGPYTYGSFEITVAEENPWDKLSRAFKKYTHTIQYTGGGEYITKDHNIKVYPRGSGSHVFEFKRPNLTVQKVELFFKGGDSINSSNPLIVGFISPNNSLYGKNYYTWQHLTQHSSESGLLDRDYINENDLITRLLEEVGLTVGSRKEKLVIRLDKQTVGSRPLQYPGSGHFKNKQVTVKKLEARDVPGFDKYEHTVPTGVNATEFYVSYDNNSRYFKVASGSGYGNLSKVTAYYEKGAPTGGHGTTGTINSRRLVFITFKIGSKGAYEYPYSQFVNDLKKVAAGTAGKKWETDSTIIIGSGSSGLESIGSGGVYQDSALQSQLTEESNKLKQIEFVNDGDGTTGSSNHNITTEKKDIDGQENVVGEGNKFQKVVIEPNTGKDGPWIVYSSKLFTREPGNRITDEGILRGIGTSSSGNGYNSITVYYSPEGRSSDGGDSSIKHMALLVKLDDYGIITYIKRLNEQGTKWDITTADSIGITGTVSDSALLPKLKELREKMRPLIEFKKGDSGKNNEHITTDTQDVGKGVVGQERYRFQKVTMTPNISDVPGEPHGGDGRGSSRGPWRVYNNNKLFSHEQAVKINDTVLTGVFTDDVTSSSSNKYSSITVYYSLKGRSDYKALLVEFVKVGGTSTGDNRGTSSTNGIRGTNETKIYFRRAMYDGSLWDHETANNIGIVDGDSVATVDMLTKIATGANIILGGPSTRTNGSSNQEATTDTLIKTGGGVAGGIAVVGGGLLLYKNFGGLLALLKK